MSTIKLAAGSAIEGGVMFATKNHYAIARYPSTNIKKWGEKLGKRLDELEAAQGKVVDENELEIIHGEVDLPIGGRVLNAIPFVAGIVGLFVELFGNNDREPWRTVRGANNGTPFTKIGTTILTCVFLLILSGFSYLVGSWVASLFGVEKGTFWFGFLASAMMTVMSLGFSVIAASFIKGDLLNFHGAEHKVGNALRNNVEFTDENIKSQSRFHTNCSTNLVVNSAITYPFIIAFLYVWLGSFILAVLLSIVVSASITAELLRISTWIGENFLAYIFNFFGLLAQRITVRDPDERHIKAATAAMNKLIELEHGE